MNNYPTVNTGSFTESQLVFLKNYAENSFPISLGLIHIKIILAGRKLRFPGPDRSPALFAQKSSLE